MLARLLDSSRWGLVAGGLLVGGLVSLLHLLLNEVSSPVVAIASWLWFVALNGFFAGAVSGAAVLALPVLSGVARRAPGPLAMVSWLLPEQPDTREGSGSVPSILPSTGFGLQVFAVIYAVFGVLYGLTYDQTVIVHPQGWVGMAVYLLVAALVVAAIGWWAAWVLLRWVQDVGLGRTAITIATVVALGHAGVVATNWNGDQGETPLVSAAGVEVVPAADGAAAPHVVLMGFDGLDPRVLDRLIAEGRLPNFERLRREGASAPLQTLPHANSAVIWSTIYTGHVPKQHGIHDFYRVQMAGLGRGLFPVHRSWFIEMVNLLSRVGLARQIPVLRGDLERFPIWEIVDHFGVSAGVIDGYLYSYPAVSLDSQDSFVIAYGADLFADDFRAGNAQIEDLGSFVQPVDLLEKEGLPRGSDFEWQTNTAFDLLATRTQPRFLNLYWHQPDALQHGTWSEFEPWRYPFTSAPDQVQMIEQHEKFDTFLGEIEAAVEPGTIFLLVSDHGHAASIVHAMDTQHRHGPDGVVMMWGDGVTPGLTLERPHVVDVVPTVLALLGLPVAEDMPGRVWTEAFGGRIDALAERRIPSYEHFWRPPAVGKERDPAALAAEIEKLKRLGYL